MYSPVFSMPINEIPAHQSSLTEKEQKEALAALYGESKPMYPNPQTEWTYEERVKIRQMLDMADQKEAANGMREFDLNKPPTPPYRHNEYPYLMYNHETGQSRAALNHLQREQLAAQGWSENPVPPEPVEVQLTARELEEAEAIDKQLIKKKK